MTIRRLNYTNRKRLGQAHVKVSIHAAGNDPAEFDTNLSLGSYDLPSNALVAVEAYRQTSWMRFPWGTVGQLERPNDRQLREFDYAEGILFRVRVTSVDTPEGVLLAEADRIRPRRLEEVEEQRISLLPVKPDDDLRDQVFRVDFSDHPILLINSRLGDWRSVGRDPVFASLVFPAAMREILTRILHIENYFDTEDSADWKSQWLQFSTGLPGGSDLPPQGEVDQIDNWIDDAVSAFCRQLLIYSRFEGWWIGQAS